MNGYNTYRLSSVLVLDASPHCHHAHFPGKSRDGQGGFADVCEGAGARGASTCSPQYSLSVLHFPEKSGIYHFLINFSSGMGEWYMKVVFEVLILFSLLSLISFT